MRSDRLQSLIERVRRHHFPNEPAPIAAAIESFEAQHGVKMPNDMRTFYLACDGVRLFQTYDTPYEFLPLRGLRRARVAIFDQDTDEYGPASIYAFCDVRDGNYVGIDLDPSSPNAFCALDCFHETFPEPAETKVVAKSFGEFLAACLESDATGLWWLYRT
jgi:cell wall assembly regulator SMI1